MRLVPLLYGLGLCVLLAVAAKLTSGYVPVGGVAIAIVFGIVVGNAVKLGPAFAPGIKFSEKRLLSIAIGLMGVNLDFSILTELGLRSILLVVLGIAVTIGSALLFARLLGFDRKFALLIGIGNGVCGSSAIAATEGIIGADEEEVGLSIAIVNLLGTVGIFLVPLLATALFHFTDLDAGVLVGNTLQAVGQVVAGGFAISDTAGQTATIVKMTRILMLTPLIFVLLAVYAKQRRAAALAGKEGGATQAKVGVPLFIIGFTLMTLVPTFRLLPENTIDLISTCSHWALIVAMAGIGLKITFASILRSGRAALGIGSLVFLVQIAFSASMIAFLLA